jgi:hypothetical protein
MAEKADVYTGQLTYREINFVFVLSGETLRLIPPDEKRKNVAWDWAMKPLDNGSYIFADPIPVGEDCIVGRCNETNNKIVFYLSGERHFPSSIRWCVLNFLPMSYVMVLGMPSAEWNFLAPR